MKINTINCPFPLSEEFVAIIETEIATVQLSTEDDVVINFRDPEYTAVDGGFHPVEMYILASGEIQYITDFAYVGLGGFAELVKEIDFDFSLNLFQHFGREFPLIKGIQLFRLWQENFISYYRMGVYKKFVSAS